MEIRSTLTAAPSSTALLAWLDAHAAKVIVQIAHDQRQKNRVILAYRDQSGSEQVCGGRTIAEAAYTGMLRNSGRSEKVSV